LITLLSLRAYVGLIIGRGEGQGGGESFGKPKRNHVNLWDVKGIWTRRRLADEISSRCFGDGGKFSYQG
jgi:hypothetical protein